MRIKLLISTVMIYVCSGFFCSALAAGVDRQDLIIIKSVWSTGVGDDKNTTDELVDIASDVERIYFWTLVQGSNSAFEILKTQGKLPIRHKWYRYRGVTPTSEGSQIPTDAISLQIGKVDIINKLRLELNNLGHFKWRTWSMKQNINPGLWVVRVVYADGSSVYCEDLGAPCEYRILVK